MPCFTTYIGLLSDYYIHVALCMLVLEYGVKSFNSSKENKCCCSYKTHWHDVLDVAVWFLRLCLLVSSVCLLRCSSGTSFWVVLLSQKKRSPYSILIKHEHTVALATPIRYITTSKDKPGFTQSSERHLGCTCENTAIVFPVFSPSLFLLLLLRFLCCVLGRLSACYCPLLCGFAPNHLITPTLSSGFACHICQL